MKLKRSIAAVAAVGAVGVPSLAAAPAALAAQSKPLVAAAVQQVQEKRFTWGDLKRGAQAGGRVLGSCWQFDGTMVIRSDGTGAWSAQVWSNAPYGATWRSSFDFYSAAGFLFQAGQFQSPLMERTATARYPWNAHFTFDPAKFGQVTRVNEFATCVASVRID